MFFVSHICCQQYHHMFFFFKQKTAYEMRISDWSSDVCSSDLVAIGTRGRFRLDGAERTVDIVGADEADPTAQRIGFAAPLAQAMIGAESGDILPFNGRPEAIEILATFPIPAEDDA